MKTKIDKEWCLDAAKREEAAGDPEIGAGALARDPSPWFCSRCQQHYTPKDRVYWCPRCQR